MAFDKAKAVNAAERSLAQGKIAAAVQEYRRIVDADPDDFTALNTLGDLYIRLDKKAEAVQCFIAVADHYREQGFALKAIAIYKKVARLRRLPAPQPDAGGARSFAPHRRSRSAERGDTPTPRRRFYARRDARRGG